MAFSPAHFEDRIRLLTDPGMGMVNYTEEVDMFKLPQDFSTPSRTLVAITGPSRAGKDTILNSLVSTPGYCHVKTATTRQRRPNESQDAYTWMRAINGEETIATYAQSLVREYDLLEHDIHHGDLYGLPRKNLLSVSEAHVPVVNTDTSGIKAIRSSLRDEYELISFLICPESAVVLQRRMNSLSHNRLARLAVAQTYLEEAPGCVDFVLLNRETDDVASSAVSCASKIARTLNRLGVIPAILGDSQQ